jgi:hypothetical protein
MGEQQFVAFCKREIVEYAHKVQGIAITENDVYVVWLCKILQNNKAMLSTTIEDGMYYEITYNGDKKEFYVDAYKKFTNHSVSI